MGFTILLKRERPRRSSNVLGVPMTGTGETHAAAHTADPFGSREGDDARTLILMRVRPSCGNTYTTRQLGERLGAIAFEFDEFVYTQVGGAADGTCRV